MPSRIVCPPCGLLLALGLASGSLAAPPPGSLAPAARSESAPLPERTLPIGNLGSVTCNARRYAINPTWTLLAAPQDDGSVRLYDIVTGQPLPTLEGGFKVGLFTYTYSKGVPPAYFGFGPDGETLVWSWGKKVVLWDVASRQIRLRREVEGSSWGFDFSLFGGEGFQEKVATAWPAPPSSGSGSRAETPDGRRVAFVNASNDVEIRDAGDASANRVLPGREKDNRGRCTSFDNDRGGPQLLWSRDGSILCDSCRVTDVWDLREAVPRLVVHTGLLRVTAGRPVLSPDGRTLAYSWGRGSRLAGGEGGFGLVDVEGARTVGPMVEVKYLGAMEFSPDSRHLATVGWVPRSGGKGGKKDYEVQIWSVEALRSGGEVTR